MESLSEFWKSARERFTNPFAFSYIVAWFSYNWKITAALFFTDVTYHQLLWIVEERNGLGVWLWPLVFAALYIIVIAYVRQVVDWLNVKFNKFGNEWVLEESKGGKVSIEKYMTEREKVLKMTKDLEQIYETETQKDTNYTELQKLHEETKVQLSNSQKDNTELQTSLNKLNKANDRLENIVNDINNPAIIMSRWEVFLDNSTRKEFELSIDKPDRVIILGTTQETTRITGVFYNRPEGKLLFYYFEPHKNKPVIFDLKIESNDIMRGTMNERQVVLKRW